MNQIPGIRRAAACLMALCLQQALQAEDAAEAAGSGPAVEVIRASVEKALPLLVKGAVGSMEKRANCFTCHNQALPVMALVTARTRGFAVDADMLRRQLEFTAGFLEKNRSGYAEGRGQGGQADTAGSALWALENGDWKPDKTTAAVAEFFLLFQKDLDHWQPQSHRPPTEQSAFTSSYLALRGLKTFGTPAQRERIEKRTEKVREWLLKTPAKDTEDRVSRLRALAVAGASAEEIKRASAELLKTQREDGGWSQLDAMESDCYAAGTALVALHQAGGLAVNEAAYRKGLRFLISRQLPDGSWHVKTRSEPIQTYYESGYPHGPDQFISITAAGWATTALALGLEAAPIKSQ
ncbi:MAG TPA: prenyltransferase/squalene oxidase repeat-containing protein [Verrucomicrobiales bacterium]|nr:prenyltransferase/squalene oxidase repeat-containing protein [Verrucomicrobiales bacterium]